ncbi:MAG: head maturation protease, ClpP-related [Aristaeellaceae bacterium]
MPKNKTVLNRPCYTLATVDGKNAELTMYGQIVEAQPRDWWGDPIDGQFIILSEFLTDLDSIKGCENLTIHLNSVGGDAYSSIAIHNRLRELAANKVCIVDGVAMSGGSLIMCACDTVKVNPSSIVMIHDCWTYVWDASNSCALRKLADSLDVINNSQAEIYVRKTGLEMDNIRAMMSSDKYMSGREAVENGFADELIEDADDPDIAVSADKRTLFACGHSMRIAAMGNLPDSIKTVETAPTSGVDITKPETSGKNGGNSMTLEELRQSDPEAAAALLAEAQASVNTDEAVQNERQRLADIDAVASLFDADTVNAAKYTNPCTAQEMCYRAAQESAKQGRVFMANLNADHKDSGAEGVPAAPASEDGDKPMSNADLMAAGEAAAKKMLGKNKEV